VLEGTVVVRTVANGRLHAETTDPGTHQKIGAGLGGRVGRARVIGGRFAELLGIIQFKIPVHLVCRDVVVADAVAPHSLQQGEGAHQVRLHERCRIVERVVVVRFGGKVDDHVSALYQRVNESRVADVTHHEPNPMRGQISEGFAPSCVGQPVEDYDLCVATVFQQVTHEVDTDEPGSASNEVGSWHTVRLVCGSATLSTRPAPDSSSLRSNV